MSRRIFGNDVAAALGNVPEGAEALEVITRLRTQLPLETARAAAELHALRARAGRRFPDGRLHFLTAKGLEQASAPAVAEARAQHIAERFPGGAVYDATCGLGSESLALAAAGLRVIAADLDEHTLACARANLEHAGQAASCVRADALTHAVRADVLLLDPDRRTDGKRTLAPERWSPAFSACLTVAANYAGAHMKLAPAFDPSAAPPIDRPARWQWVSLKRSLVEVGLWLGELGPGDPAEREVLALDGQGGAARWTARPAEIAALAPEQARAIQWLAEPDPAIIRAGLVGAYAAECGARPLDPHLAYLGSMEAPDGELLARWRVLEVCSLDRKRVREMLRRADIGPLTVKKRGHPDTALELARRLEGPGERPGLLAVARLGNGHVAYLLDPESA